MGGQSPPTLWAYRAEHKNMWSRGTSTDHLVNLDEKWALTGITEISSPSPSLPVSSQSVCLSLSFSFPVQWLPPITCTQSLVVLGDNATVPLSKRSKRPSLGSWFLVFGLKTAGCWSQMQHLEVNLAAAERHESSAPLNSWPRPWSGSLFSSSCGCSLTPNRDHREIPKMEKKTRRSNAESLAVFPTLSLPGRLPGSCKSIPTHVGKTRSRCPVCRGLTPSRMPGYCPVLFDWSGPSMSSSASRR